ncbi:MAG TPA: hypothetical protein VLT45_25695, partial [Kofleriaceae bacterium]|nr:hypothetical protein [Kofleriaceae bacterium]
IAEAIAGDYDSQTQRDRAIDSAVRNAAVNTACMYIGQALIETGNPIGIAAGAIIMFLGPTILGKLFDDTPESLYPDVVTETGKTLASLLAEYKAVVGGLEYQKRDPKARASVGLPGDIDATAKDSVFVHRMRALYLEQQLLYELWSAYDETREGGAGLREIDEMRRQFLELRAQASTDESDEEARKAINDLTYPDPEHIPPDFYLPPETDEAGHVVPIREVTLRNLRDMESNLSLDKMTADQIRGMKQWSSIKDSALDLVTQVLRAQAIDPDWTDIGQRQHDLEARVASARYRLDPAAQAEDPRDPARDVPLLSPGTEARRIYEEKLAEAERWLRFAESMVMRNHFVNLRNEGVETPNIEAFWNNARFDSPLEAHIAVADDALDLYQRMIELIDGPPPSVGGVEALYREPSARLAYLGALNNDRTFRKNIQRLEVNETAARSLLRSLSGEVAADNASRGKVDKLRERFEALQNDRKERRGILYSYELEALDARERQRAIAYFTPLLGGKDTDPVLTQAEIAAAKTGDYGDVGTQLLGERRTVAERLAQIPNLRIPTGPVEVLDASGTPIRVSRLLSGIMRLDALSSNERMLVGIVDWTALPAMAKVVPLDDDAATALGGYAATLVAQLRLMPANEDDLKP